VYYQFRIIYSPLGNSSVAIKRSHTRLHSRISGLESRRFPTKKALKRLTFSSTPRLSLLNRHFHSFSFFFHHKHHVDGRDSFRALARRPRICVQSCNVATTQYQVRADSYARENCHPPSKSRILSPHPHISSWVDRSFAEVDLIIDTIFQTNQHRRRRGRGYTHTSHPRHRVHFRRAG
jgi:hypothetical protein